MRSKDSLSILVLLSLAMGLNASPEAVLCLGSHGHVAVEPVHDRCADSIRIHESESAEHCADFTSCPEASCRDCTDIPLPNSLYGNDGASSASKNGCVRSIVAFYVSPCPEDGVARTAVQVSAEPSVCYCISLRSIVLQV